MNLKNFIDKFGSALAKKIEQGMTPLYDPLNPTGVEWVEDKIGELLRKPFPVQKEVIKGLCKALYTKEKERLFISGEMGTGKTFLALATIAMSPVPMRTLVLCPTHLVEKWAREAKETIPDVTVVDLATKGTIKVLSSLTQKRKIKPQKHEVYIISKERCKLGYGWKGAAMQGRLLSKKGQRSGVPRCPRCGTKAMTDDVYLSFEVIDSKKKYCQQCGEALWQADSKLRRVAPAEFIKKYMKNFFDLVVIDEVHDYKAGDSLQGNAMGQVLSASRKSLCLTGTLNGGYADDLFFLLLRIDPKGVIKEGFEYRKPLEWSEAFGTIERVQKIEERDAYYGRSKKKSVIVKKKPGVSPLVVGKFLLDKSAFIRLADVIDGLPPYEESVISVPLGEQTNQYKKLEADLRSAVQKYKTKALGAMLQALMSYPDSCVLYPEHIEIRDKKTGTVEEIISAAQIDSLSILPKEAELVNLIEKEKKEGRKVLCYLTFTGSRDIRPRLKDILEKNGFVVGVLDSTVEPKKREAWINKHTKDIDVLLVNAELVKTGLDLYDFPTVVFYQVGFNIFTLRQAARRSWRIGQTRPVKVFYFCYQNTMQETALTLIAKKLEVSLMVEGDLPEGLAEYTASGDSIIEQLGKALIDDENYSGAEKAWANFRQKEVETQLSINGKETIFSEKTEKKVFENKKVTVKENTVIKVTLFEGNGKKRSTLEVEFGKLNEIMPGKTLQLALF